jgi:hypothetical protein
LLSLGVGRETRFPMARSGGRASALAEASGLERPTRDRRLSGRLHLDGADG